ncbi:hypothetical protein LTR85_002246 [Meristemomyces frigidus]|nr:hypothetical protein LTR85_002246 [Meristemomyces frigidus]
MAAPNQNPMEMAEDPKHHDFDQRHDGPFEQPSINLRRRSLGDGATGPIRSEGFQSHVMSPVGRKSMQATRAPGRSSTQMSGRGRPSQDFDTRRDGPFGRPSITMTRRKSSGTLLPTSPEGRPSMAAIEKAVQEHDAEHEAASQEGPVSIETMQSGRDAAFEPEPPPLNYSLAPRKWSLMFFWSLILIDCIAMPIGLYFGLWYGVGPGAKGKHVLSANAVFSIVTAALGGVSILEYVLRFKRLWQKGSTCRVIGARRSYLDWFHWNFSLGWVIIMVELIVGTIPTNPPIRLLAMPVTSMLYAFGTELLIVDIMRYFQVPAPIRISSVPKGSQLRPGIYSIIEDVIAVDGSGGTTFRENLNKRYEASHVFRAMLRRLGAFWAVGAEGIAVVTTILIFTLSGEVAYVVGWALPFVWAGIWTLATYLYVKKNLREEQRQWAEEVATKSAA